MDNNKTKYFNSINPLVSILIPAYNRPHYLKIALKSALNQTYKNIEVIICDDSTNNEVEIMIKKKYLNKYKNLKYYKNEKNLGQFENDLKLLELASGEYINFLMDDDVFAINKIEKMMKYFMNDKGKQIKLVTSHREIINKEGKKLFNKGELTKIYSKDVILDGINFGNYVLANNFNCIGEPTTAIFRKKDLIEPFGIFYGRKYICNVDLATWLNLLSQGKIVYISETLSYFRIHEEQQLNSNKMKLSGALDYVHQVLTAREKGFLKDKIQYQKAASNCLKNFHKILRTFKNKGLIDQSIINEFNNYYEQFKENKVNNRNKA
ncbi:glycosyltransferase [Oceanirhabdus seepicola]|uniref:Glycosyltransferase n=1 Tax=Oceanirhabdus seepicola TaxID=2828781 RepID=A0A9J6NZ59_9CLOT|nr:glycosyltransferase [Oceanirhabdus seepicola]MCM1989262.1 glycosyltransferase [Oceanirhabdus seepicola]